MKKYSELRDTKRLPLERLLPLKFPLAMYIETTNRCNYRCRYCPESLADFAKIAGGYRTMSFAQFEKICRQIQAGGGLKVLRLLYMGEPLMNPLLPEMISLAHRMKLAQRIELTSNASLLDDEKSRAIINSGLNYLRVSISSVSQRRHEYVTQTKVQVKQVYENLRRFRQLRDSLRRRTPFLYIKMLDSLDKEENATFLKMYKKVADEAVIEKPMNWDNYRRHDFLQDIYRGKRIPAAKELYLYPKEVCPFPFYTLMVSVNGDATVCCVDWNKGTLVGNVFKSTIQAIWNGTRMREFRRMHLLRKRGQHVSCAECRYSATSPDNLDHMPESKIEAILKPNK